MNNQLFSPDTDWKNNACLNWCHDSMHLYISGYKDAADYALKVHRLRLD